MLTNDEVKSQVVVVGFGDRWRLWSRHRRRCGSGVCVLTEVVWSITRVGRIVLADGEVACVFGLAEMACTNHTQRSRVLDRSAHVEVSGYALRRRSRNVSVFRRTTS